MKTGIVGSWDKSFVFPLYIKSIEKNGWQMTGVGCFLYYFRPMHGRPKQ